MDDASLEPGAIYVQTRSTLNSESTSSALVNPSTSSETSVSMTSSHFGAETPRIQPLSLPCCDHFQSTETVDLHLDDNTTLGGSTDRGCIIDSPNGKFRGSENTHSYLSEGRIHGESPVVYCSTSRPLGYESRDESQQERASETSAWPAYKSPSDGLNRKDPRRAAPVIPNELWIPIAAFLVSMSSGAIDPYMLSASKWKDIEGLSWTSRYHRSVVLRIWASTLVLKNNSDISFFKQLGEANQFDALALVKIILCPDSYQVYTAPQEALLDFKHIEELVLDVHSDICFREATVMPNANIGEAPVIIPPRMSYKNLGARFPCTLKTLRLFHGHCPDIAIIRKAASDCPELEVLTLGRCTMFTEDQCRFWGHLPPGEHDAYFSNEDVEDYAVSI